MTLRSRHSGSKEPDGYLVRSRTAFVISILLAVRAVRGFAPTPKIDRCSNLGAVGGRRISRAHYKSKVLISVSLMIVLACSMMTILSQQPQESDDTPYESPAPARIKYAFHAPIFIQDNLGFLESNASTGISWGSGTAGDPFIIGYWDIDASTKNGIEIRDSDMHFITRNCYIHDGKSGIHYGIVLANVANGSLTENSLSNHHAGTLLGQSKDLTISNNTFSSNDHAMMEGSLRGCTISNNTCDSNGDCIELLDSNNCTIENNTCSNNLVNGINLVASSNCTIKDNNCSSNQWTGIFIHRATLDNSSRDNIVTRNVLYENVKYGMRVTDDSSNNRIWNNTFYHNNGAGDTYDPAHVQAVSNALNWWDSGTGYGNWWSDWTIPDYESPYGIVDIPYDIAGGAGAKYYYPLTTTPTEPIPEFVMTPLVVTVMFAVIVMSREVRLRKAS